MSVESHEEKFNRLVKEEEEKADAEKTRSPVKEEYLAVKLCHNEETASTLVTEFMNEYAKDGWRLHSTQFLPIVKPVEQDDDDIFYSGDLMFFFHRPKS
jgi:hypothetical protein